MTHANDTEKHQKRNHQPAGSLVKYRTEVDERNINSSQPALLRHVVSRLGDGGRVLDVGCAAGDLARALAGHGLVVSGVEFDPVAAEVALPDLESLVVADLNTLDLASAFSQPFDAIVFGDVLEHISDPERVLRMAHEMLTPNGFIAISIPNIAHGSVRLSLLQGKWDYADEGLLDRTHLRFFTLSSVKELVRSAEFRIEELESTVLDPLGTDIAVDHEALPPGVLDWVRDQPNSADFQFIVIGTPVSQDEADSAPAPDVRPLAQIERPLVAHLNGQESLQDAQARIAQLQGLLARFESDRSNQLTTRDYAIATEVECGRLRHQLEQDRATWAKKDALLTTQHHELVDTHARLAAVTTELIETHARLAEVTTALLAKDASVPEEAPARRLDLPRRVLALPRRVVGKLRRVVRGA